MELDDDRRLDAAVSLGIITAEQAAAIRGLTPEPAGRTLPRPPGAATLGYVLGALTVLVAMGWFLADRWKWLGPGGVLAVAILYAALFIVVAGRLRAAGAPQASGMVVLLAVGMTPVGLVALFELLDWFPAYPGAVCWRGSSVFWACRGEEIAVELGTALAALIALRRVRFAPLVLPLAALALRGLVHLAQYATDVGAGAHGLSWLWVAAASLLAAVAYETSRRQRGDEDFALWLHLAAALSAMVASVMLLTSYEPLRHLLIPSAFIAFAFSVRMRRFVWTLLGLWWFVAYLGWLAEEVFRETPFFPIVLAALGVSVIILTVWLQRNRERLVARFGQLEGDGRPGFPGGSVLMLVTAVVAMLQFPAAVEVDRAQRLEGEAAGRAHQALGKRKSPPSETPLRLRP